MKVIYDYKVGAFYTLSNLTLSQRNPWVFTCLQYKSFENTVGRGDFAIGSMERLENTVEKRRNCSLRDFSFSHRVFKRLMLQTPKNQGLFGKGLNQKRLDLYYPVVLNSFYDPGLNCSLSMRRSASMFTNQSRKESLYFSPRV